MDQMEQGRGPDGFEMRRGDRRQAERRQGERGGFDRRRGDRRAGMCAGAVLTLTALAFVPEARADIFTRKNASGVTEATNLPSGNDFKLVYRSKGVVIHSPGFTARPSANHDFDDHIQAAAAAHGVNEGLIRAVIQVESQFDRLAVSTAGARGLMQLMPATARMLGVADSFDARQNIFGGTLYLKQLLRRYGGDISLAAAAYNAGEGAVAKYNGIPPYKETQGYVRKVNALLGTAVAAVAAEIPAMFIAEGEGARMNPPPAPRTVGGRILAAATRPRGAATKPAQRVYYRWKDAKGVLHMSETPPPSGEYTTIKSSI